MITDEKKKRIESLSKDEMEHEINLGRRSRFQREAFAYLQTCYQHKLAEIELRKAPNPTTKEQFEAIIKMYSEGTLDECSEKELKQYQAFLLKHGAMDGFNETTYYKMLGYVEKLIVSKIQDKSNINQNIISATNSTVVVGNSNVVKWLRFLRQGVKQ